MENQAYISLVLCYLWKMEGKYMSYIDLHCDTLGQAFLKQKNTITVMPEDMVDINRLEKAKVLAQFFAIFLLPPGEEKPDDDEYINTLVQVLHDTIRENPDKIAMAHNVKEMELNCADGKTSAFLTIEDGRSVDGKIEKLEKYYDMGVRLITLTWNFENCFGSPNSLDPNVMKKGLTTFGKEGVKRMEELGMLVDVSHLSDGGFYDVADILSGPFVASHSNCRELANHPRNLTNDMIRVLANKGGVSGINFFHKFLNNNHEEGYSNINDMIRHINHMVRYGGEDIVAIGTDFDGISGVKYDIKSPDQMYLLFDALKKEGYSERQIDKFAYENALRVMKDVIK